MRSKGGVVTGCARREAIGLAERASANPEGAARARAHFDSPRSSRTEGDPYGLPTGREMARSFSILAVPFLGLGGDIATGRVAFMV